jgi:ribosomal protein S27AE
MLDTQTIKCPKCGWDSLFPLNQPMLIVLTHDIICPHCGTIVIQAFSTTILSDGYFLDEHNDYYKHNPITRKF